jgi:hypothetical protein
MEQIVKIRIWVPDQNALKHILASAHVEHECGSPRRDSDNSFVVTLYATPAEAQKITSLGYRHETDDKFGEYLAERQAEVSKVDRFQGGKIKPEGLGVKR